MSEIRLTPEMRALGKSGMVSPLGGGRIGASQDERFRSAAATLYSVADAAGVSRAAGACASIRAHPACTIPIVGTQNVQRIAEIADVDKVRHTRRTRYDVLIAARGERLP